MSKKRNIPSVDLGKNIVKPCYSQNKERLIQSLLIISGFFITSSIDDLPVSSFASKIYMTAIMLFLVSCLLAYIGNALPFHTSEDMKSNSYLIGMSFSSVLIFFFILKNALQPSLVPAMVQIGFGFLIFLALYTPENTAEANELFKPLKEKCNKNSRLSLLKFSILLIWFIFRKNISYSIMFLILSIAFYLQMLSTS